MKLTQKPWKPHKFQEKTPSPQSCFYLMRAKQVNQLRINDKYKWFFKYHLPFTIRQKLGGAAEHLINSSEKHIRRLSVKL